MRVISLLSILFVLSAFAETSNINFTGVFVELVQTYIVGYMDGNSCTTDGGDWDADMEICFFNAQNTARVQESETGMSLLIDTIGGNAHSCVFEGPVTTVLPEAVVSEVEAGYYDDTTQSYVQGICRVTVKFQSADTVMVETNGKCSEFCGMRAMLEMGPANRQ